MRSCSAQCKMARQARQPLCMLQLRTRHDMDSDQKPEIGIFCLSVASRSNNIRMGCCRLTGDVVVTEKGRPSRCGENRVPAPAFFGRPPSAYSTHFITSCFSVSFTGETTSDRGCISWITDRHFLQVRLFEQLPCSLDALVSCISDDWLGFGPIKGCDRPHTTLVSLSRDRHEHTQSWHRSLRPPKPVSAAWKACPTPPIILAEPMSLSPITRAQRERHRSWPRTRIT